MSAGERAAKLKGHAQRLTSLFFELKENYAFLEPMLFDRGVIDSFGAGARARGFNAIKYALLYTCIQDAAKLVLDEDERAPSVVKLMRALADEPLRAALRADYSRWMLTPDDTDPPEVAAALRRMETREEIQRAERFDEMYASVTAQWAALEGSPDLLAFKTIRDKLTAHTELRKVGDEYKPLDIAGLGLKWGALQTTIAALQPMVESLSLLIANLSVEFESLERNLKKASAAFWESKRAPA